MLQIGGLFLPTCPWPGLTALLKRFRVSWLSWRLWPEPFSHNLMQSWMDLWALPDLSLSELWHKCYTVCHWPIKASVTVTSVSETVGIFLMFLLVCVMYLLILPIHFKGSHIFRTAHASVSPDLSVTSTWHNRTALKMSWTIDLKTEVIDLDWVSH